MRSGPKFDTPSMYPSLVASRRQDQVLLLYVYKSLNNRAPNYSTDILKLYNASNSNEDSRRRLRPLLMPLALFEASSWGHFVPRVWSVALESASVSIREAPLCSSLFSNANWKRIYFPSTDFSYYVSLYILFVFFLVYIVLFSLCYMPLNLIYFIISKIIKISNLFLTH